MRNLFIWLFSAIICLCPHLADARVSSGILNLGVWKAGSNGIARIHVCFETQNMATQENWVKEALSATWAHFANIDFTYTLGEVPLKGNGNSFACDQNFPGIKVKLVDAADPPSTMHGSINWIKADAGTEANWPQGTRPSSAMNMFLNPTFNNYMGSAGLSSSEKANLFKHYVVHEFGHALGFIHEHELSAASGALSPSCMEAIRKQGDFLTDKEKSDRNFQEYGTYSRLSIMHYFCMMDPNFKPQAGEHFVFQTALGPTDIATVRVKYGTRNPTSFPNAKWGTPTAKGLEGILITGNETEFDLRSKLGNAPSGVYVNHRYYTVSSLAIPNVPGPGRLDLKPVMPGVSYYVSGSPMGPNGHPVVVLGGSMGGNAQIEYRVTASNGVVGGVTYPGYEITLKSLGSAFAQAVPELGTMLYSTLEPDGFEAFTRKYEKVGGSSPDRTVLYLNKLPASKIVWPSLGHYDNQPHTVVPQAEFKFWIPKGYGNYDSQAGEFYALQSSAPRNMNWYYTTNGQYRVSNNFTHIELKISALSISVNNNVSVYQPPETIKLLFPQSPLDPSAYFTRVGGKLGNLVKVPSNGLSGSKRINSFYIMQTEVTQKEYQILMGRNPFFFPLGPAYPVEGTTYYDAVLYSNRRSEWEGLQPAYSFSNPVFSADGKNCIGVSNLAVDFRKNGYRLPTFDEWRHAYSEGTADYYWPSGSWAGHFAWYNGNSGNSPHPVAKKEPNDRLLFDIAGNVLEWVMYPGTNPNNYGYQMGGSWIDGITFLGKNQAFNSTPMSEVCAHTGFRLVRRAPPNLTPMLDLLLHD